MLCGDFNLIYKDEDKNNGHLDRRMMGRFRRVLNDLALKEIYLNGRHYTWSNEQSPPTLVHLDRSTGRSSTAIATCDALHPWCRTTVRCSLTALPYHQLTGGSTSRTSGHVWTVSGV
jgi:hypothetical protein